MQKHWIYRFCGTYAGLVEDMDKIVRHDPETEIINVQQTGNASRQNSRGSAENEYLIYTRKEVPDPRQLRIVKGMEALDAYLPARVVVDDTGGPFSGYPSVCGSAESDVTLIHQDGFIQQYWGDLSQGKSLALAHFIVEKLNERLK